MFFLPQGFHEPLRLSFLIRVALFLLGDQWAQFGHLKSNIPGNPSDPGKPEYTAYLFLTWPPINYPSGLNYRILLQSLLGFATQNEVPRQMGSLDYYLYPT